MVAFGATTLEFSENQLPETLLSLLASYFDHSFLPMTAEETEKERGDLTALI
jgi:hypothetical protein